MKLLIYWLPAACLVMSALNAVVPVPYFYEELGIVENLTVIFLLAALGNLFAYGFRDFKSLVLMDRVLILLLVTGCVYFAGEEMSWGQHYLGFETSESYRKFNYQGEMNLHNTKGLMGDLLDRIPRNILTAGIFLGGVIFPFFKSRLPAWIRRYVPPKPVVFVSVLAVFVSVPQKFFKSAEGAAVDRRGGDVTKYYEARFDGGEMKEMYIGLFILLFTLNMLRVLKTERQSETARNKAPLTEGNP